jgi:hypothetical protein
MFPAGAKQVRYRNFGIKWHGEDPHRKGTSDFMLSLLGSEAQITKKIIGASIIYNPTEARTLSKRFH